ncbi:hypothetical protein D9615_005068 [Tricholomella constricta]|uniref:BTB domain-containing protein n=1 Tax=Tricholomella constricta TaxID=117010 RepID=A0A8H5HH16_9AGAR|nr:hypothetical protein D9615_005068 [Tricholomella constricta]
MERLLNDEWSLGTNPSSITSTFKLPVVNGHSLSIDKGPIFTGSCGLGWRFVVSAINGDAHVQSWGAMQIHQKTIYEISLDPHHILATNLAQLSTSITVENLSLRTKGSSTISLRTSSERTLLATYFSIQDFTGDASITIKVEFNPSFNMLRTSEPVVPKLQHALESSLMGHEIGDTKFYLFTRRASQVETVVCDPQLICANASLLRGSCEYLDKLLDGDNPEKSVLGHQLHSDAQASYDYFSDSDLEDPECDDAEHQKVSKNKGRGKQKATPQHRAIVADDERVIFLDDIAFETWKSLVFYFYTRKIHFKPLSSCNKPLKPKSDAVDGPPMCSPKSMYRLAHKMGIPELQALALKAIAGNLSEHNILTEVFSSFTSKYPKVQEIEVEALMRLLTPVVFEQFLQKMKAVVEGRLPFCYDVLAAVMHKIYDSGVGREEGTSSGDSMATTPIQSSITVPDHEKERAHTAIGLNAKSTMAEIQWGEALLPSPAPLVKGRPGVRKIRDEDWVVE